MNHLTTLALALCSTCAFAQKHLPSKITITLTDKQFMHMDSCINYGASLIDSKKTTDLYLSGFAPIWEQANRQLVVDSVKVSPKTK